MLHVEPHRKGVGRGLGEPHLAAVVRTAARMGIDGPSEPMQRAQYSYTMNTQRRNHAFKQM